MDIAAIVLMLAVAFFGVVVGALFVLYAIDEIMRHKSR